MKHPELSGKRLLILGGSLWKSAIKNFADENDITIIATGNDQTAGIFEIADEAYAVSNAHEKLKIIATGIIGSNDNDAVVKFICKHSGIEI